MSILLKLVSVQYAADKVDLLRLSLHSEIHLRSVSRMAFLTSEEISGKPIFWGWLLATSAKGLPTVLTKGFCVA